LKKLKLDSSKKALVLFLGSSIGNHSLEESVKLLKAIRQVLSSGDALLLGADLKKSVEVLEPAYDDSLGVTAAFNLNVLAHINRELNADFDIRAFRHVAFYNSDLGRIEMHLESRKAQTVFIKKLNQKVEFAEGERIHTENSYKYDTESLSSLARRTGFELKHMWRDNQSYFSDNLFAVTQE
jgi:dimethylhistidine N-methyltransferase